MPIGQDISTKILVDLSNVELKINNRQTFKITEIEDEKDDFSKVNVKTINVFEYDVIIKKENEEEESKKD